MILRFLRVLGSVLLVQLVALTLLHWMFPTPYSSGNDSDNETSLANKEAASMSSWFTHRMEVVDGQTALTCVTTFAPNSSTNSTLDLMTITSILTNYVDSWKRTTRGKGGLLLVDDGSSEGYRNFLTQLQKTEESNNIHVYLRPSNGGIARSKNTCIRLFLRFQIDHLFLSDHDLAFTRPGWQELYINKAIVTGIGHFSLYLDNQAVYSARYINPRTKEIALVSETPGLNGVLLYVNRRLALAAGGMRIFPSKYGHEHVEFTVRAMRLGFAPYYCDVPISWRFFVLQSSRSVLNDEMKARAGSANHKYLMHILGDANASLSVPLIES